MRDFARLACQLKHYTNNTKEKYNKEGNSLEKILWHLDVKPCSITVSLCHETNTGSLGKSVSSSYENEVIMLEDQL